jgi:phosphohistidine phosphatase
MGSGKILTILRHAKAEIGSAVQGDHERGLNERGVQAALAMGNYLSRRNEHLDLVLCSTSRRTRQTLEQLHLQPEPEIVFNEKLYLASANEVLAAIAQLPETVTNILILAHNPGLHQLCLKLAHKGDESLIDVLSMKFPTCAMARFNVAGSWQTLGADGAELAEFITPKALSLVDED